MPPRRNFIAPTPKRIAEWYGAQHREALNEAPPELGLEARYWNVLCYIAETGAPLDELRLVVNTDPKWPDRPCRGGYEYLAKKLGETVRGNQRRVFWILPCPILMQAARQSETVSVAAGS